jgi:SpoVK/Ycf46/Vps4 family AAA+-type ATPase
VISLMQELEHSVPSGLVVATSNLPGHLDHALWRRFDLTVLFPRPSKTALREHAKRLASIYRVKASMELVATAQRATNFAELEHLVAQEARRTILRAERL